MNLDQHLAHLQKRLAVGEWAAAHKLLEELVGSFSDQALPRFLLGATLHALGERVAAIDAFRKAIELAPEFVPALNALATVLVEEGQFTEALDAMDRAVALAPADARTLHNRGVVLEGLGRVEVALEAYESAVALDPGFAPSWANRGAVLMTFGQFEAAVENNRRLVTLLPDSADAWFNLAESLLGHGKSEEGLAACERALALDPRHAKAHVDRGLALADLGRFEEARLALGTAEAASPGAIRAYLDKVAPADPAFERSLDPRLVFLYRGHERLMHCDWSMRDLYVQRLIELVRDAAGEDSRHVDLPLAYHSLTVPVPQNIPYRIARIIGDRYAAAVAEIAVQFVHRRNAGRIRIGYLSADYWEHLNAYLSYPLFRLHDRSKFEVFAYNIGPDDRSEIRACIQDRADRFVDLRALSDVDAARRINEDGVDVLVDFGGYTQHCRPGIAALRPAPVQLAHIGFPGTMGASWIDYRLTDRVATPPEQMRFWHEKLVFMPDSFFVYDGEQTVPFEPVARAEYGLPERAFVFCSHNSSYKLEPEIFSTWMSLLHELPDAVLWLVARDPCIEPRLRAEAHARGVASERLIFARPESRSRYFSRFRLADLFLDTPQFNAATTACDALWMGLPLLTLRRAHFTSRVAASILCALEIPDLIVDTMDEYRTAALRFGTDRAKFAEVGRRVREARQKAPMFRTADYVRHYESALQAMVARWRQGKPPAHLHVNNQGKVEAN